MGHRFQLMHIPASGLQLSSEMPLGAPEQDLFLQVRPHPQQSFSLHEHHRGLTGFIAG